MLKEFLSPRRRRRTTQANIMTTDRKALTKATTTSHKNKVYFSSKAAPWDIQFPQAGDDAFKLWVLLVCPKALRLSVPKGW